MTDVYGKLAGAAVKALLLPLVKKALIRWGASPHTVEAVAEVINDIEEVLAVLPDGGGRK